MASDLVVILGYGTLGGLAFVLIPRLLLWVFGFTPCGVRKSTYASEWHSLLGEAEAGSPFSCLQSIGAGGAPCGIKIGVFLFGCYLTIVLIIMHDFSNMSPEPSEHLNFTTDSFTSALTNFTADSFTSAPTNFTDFITLKTTLSR